MLNIHAIAEHELEEEQKEMVQEEDKNNSSGTSDNLCTAWIFGHATEIGKKNYKALVWTN